MRGKSWTRDLIFCCGVLVLASGPAVATAAAQGGNASDKKVLALKKELKKRIGELRDDLKNARKLAEPMKQPTQAPLAALSLRRKETVAKGLRTITPIEPADREDQERRDAARALERLQIDTRLDRNRKLDELLLERLR